jgi:DNA polymerase III delta prime subunit
VGREVRPPSDTPVLILTGPPGVGKTTAAALLAERFERSVHLESDAFFRFIHGGFIEPWKPESHDQNRLVMEVVAAAAAAYAAGGYLTIVAGIVIPRWFLAPLRDDLDAIAGIWEEFATLGEFEPNAIEVGAGAEEVAAEVERRLLAGRLAI